MSANEELIKAGQQPQPVSAVDSGDQEVSRKSRAISAVTQEFDFDAFESNTMRHPFVIPGYNPIMLDVRTDAVKSEHLAGYNRAINQLSADARTRATLRVKKAHLQQEQAALGMDFFDDQIDEATLTAEELADREAFKEIEGEIAKIDEQLKELDQHPQTIDEIRVDHIIVPMLAGWDAKRGGVSVPVDRASLLSCGVRFIDLLTDELINLARGNVTEQKKPKRRGPKSRGQQARF